MIPITELLQRHDAFRAKLIEKGLAGAIIFRPQRIQYFINFLHLSTERPIALIFSVDGDPAMLVPKLEEEHLRIQAPWMKNIHMYFEYPGETHPLIYLKSILGPMHFKNSNLGIDNDGFLDQNSYQGPTLSSLVDNKLEDIGYIVDEMRMIKSEVELERLRESGHWAAITHRFLQDEITAGKSEREISRIAEEKAYIQLEEKAGTSGHFGSVGLHASFRSGSRTSMGHAAMGGRRVEPGDNLVTYCQGLVSGYITELERTMFMGEPSKVKRDHFQIVQEAQQMALEMLRPGILCSELDRKIRRYFEQMNKTDLTQHHQGHGLGLEFHEAPFLDIGDNTELKEGMVISVEPGLYIEGVGGFRHSDTVAITVDGYEILTPYPSKLEDLIIEI